MFFLSFLSLLLVFLLIFFLSAVHQPAKNSLDALHDMWLDEYTYAPDGDALAASRPQHLT